MLVKAVLLLIELQHKASKTTKWGSNKEYSQVQQSTHHWEVDVGQGCIAANRTAEENN
jgi:hypothetical protein